jgi:hypothetical protein
MTGNSWPRQIPKSQLCDFGNYFACSGHASETRCNRILASALKTLPFFFRPMPTYFIVCLFEDPSGEVALDMPRLSKRWQILELYRFNGHVYATPTLITAYVFR